MYVQCIVGWQNKYWCTIKKVVSALRARVTILWAHIIVLRCRSGLTRGAPVGLPGCRRYTNTTNRQVLRQRPRSIFWGSYYLLSDNKFQMHAPNKMFTLNMSYSFLIYMTTLLINTFNQQHNTYLPIYLQQHTTTYILTRLWGSGVGWSPVGRTWQSTSGLSPACSTPCREENQARLRGEKVRYKCMHGGDHSERTFVDPEPIWSQE